MPRLIPEPQLDESAKVGLNFIGLGYGVVLVAVFPMTKPEKIGQAGWFHLALAASVLVVSYMGYYSNRQDYPNWRVQFFNIPLLQYIISFGILFMYWELGITVPEQRGEPTPFSEALILLLVYLAYLVWDCLEVAVQESSKYIDVLVAAGDRDTLPPWSYHYRQGLRFRCGIITCFRWKGRSRERFAKDVRGRRLVTFLFSCLYGLSLALIWWSHWSGKDSVIIIDSLYIASLFAYRYLQWAWPRVWYHRTGSPA